MFHSSGQGTPKPAATQKDSRARRGRQTTQTFTMPFHQGRRGQSRSVGRLALKTADRKRPCQDIVVFASRCDAWDSLPVSIRHKGNSGQLLAPPCSGQARLSGLAQRYFCDRVPSWEEVHSPHIGIDGTQLQDLPDGLRGFCLSAAGHREGWRRYQTRRQAGTTDHKKGNV